LPNCPSSGRRTVNGTLSKIKLNSPALLVMTTWSEFGGFVGVRARPRVLTGTKTLTDVFGIRVKPVANDAVGISPNLYSVRAVCVCE
jgi:hypothetical protein